MGVFALNHPYSLFCPLALRTPCLLCLEQPPSSWKVPELLPFPLFNSELSQAHSYNHYTMLAELMGGKWHGRDSLSLLHHNQGSAGKTCMPRARIFRSLIHSSAHYLGFRVVRRLIWPLWALRLPANQAEASSVSKTQPQNSHSITPAIFHWSK